jgi:ATP-binding cassette subfamily C protein
VRAVLDLPPAVVERVGVGDLMTRGSSDVGNVGYTLRDALPDVFIALVRVVFIYGALFLLHPLLGLCGLISLPILTMITRWYLRRGRDAYLAEGAANSDLVESMTGTVAGARTVEAFRLGAERIEDGNRRIETLYRTRVRTLGLRSVLFPVTDLAHAVGMAAMLVLGAAFLAGGRVGLGAVIAASLYMWQLVDPLDSLLQWAEQLQSSAASMARVTGVDRVETGAEPVGTPAPAGDLIEISGLRYAYEAGRDVLCGVDLVVRPGERLAIVGPSGSGKSTLGRLIAGIESPTAGSVTVGGIAVSGLPADERRRRFALISQEHHVFLGTLRDNLALAAPEADDAAMWQALDGVGAGWARRLPDGLDTEVGGPEAASDAVRAQQLALARVVLADPRTVILDEATAMLDPRTARHTEHALASVLRGRTVLAIAHRLHTARDADRIAIMVAGRVVEVGTHDELVGTNGHYAALWNSWCGTGERSNVSVFD